MIGRAREGWRDDGGSAVAEFTMVGALLTVLTVSVLQFAIGLYVRTTVLDAAAEGARFGALADNVPGDSIQRTIDLITEGVGSDYATDVSVSEGAWLGHPSVIVTVRTTLPVIGLIGIASGLEVAGHAARETLD